MRSKNFFLLALVIAAVLLWAIKSEGAVHTVSSGETLGSIGNRYDCDYREIKRVVNGRTLEIQNKNLIRPGWKLYIPYKAQSRAEKREKADAISKTYVVKSGDTLRKIGERFGVDYKSEIFRLKNGEPQEIKNKSLIYPGEKLLISSSSSSLSSTSSSSVDGKEEEMEGEVSKASEEKETEETEGKKSEEKKTDSFYSALSQVEDDSEKEEESQPHSRAEKSSGSKSDKKLVEVKGFGEALDTLNVTHSNYGDLDVSGEDRTRRGYNWDIRARFRPFRIGNWDVGLWGYINDGVSKSERSDGRRDRYEYSRFGFGPSAEWEKDNLSLALEAAFARQVTEGSYSHSERTQKQTTELLEFRAWLESDARRKNAKVWFPKWGIGAKYLHPISEDFESSDGKGEVYDEARWDISGVAWIYDWWFSSNWRLTSGLNAGLGYLYGKESLYIQGGPRFELGNLNNGILDVSILNPRYFFEEEARDASRLYWITATLKVDDLARTLWASQIKDYDSSEKSEKSMVASSERKEKRSPFYNERAIDGP
ncbi:MAG: LysM peptidoglycan-binding domain-containing protein [Patescibacteria group bacterium]